MTTGDSRLHGNDGKDGDWRVRHAARRLKITGDAPSFRRPCHAFPRGRNVRATPRLRTPERTLRTPVRPANPIERNQRHDERTNPRRLLILGSGPAGYTAAVYAARANLSPMLVTGIEVGGQMTTTTDVDKLARRRPGRAGPGADGADAPARGAVRHEARPRPHLARGPLAAPVPPAWRLRDLHLRRARHRHRRVGEVSRARLRGGVQGARGLGLRHLRRVLLRSKPVAVVGGGNTAVEEALYLSNIASTVTVVHRRDRFRPRRSSPTSSSRRPGPETSSSSGTTCSTRSSETMPESRGSASAGPPPERPGPSTCTAASSPSATRPTPGSSRGSSR